jgi:hypothetical protein
MVVGSTIFFLIERYLDRQSRNSDVSSIQVTRVVVRMTIPRRYCGAMEPRREPGTSQESLAEAFVAVNWSRRSAPALPELPPYLGYRESAAADIAASRVDAQGHRGRLREPAEPLS